MSLLLRAEAERIRLMERCRLGGDGEGKGMVAKLRGKGKKKERRKTRKLKAAKEEVCLKMERGEMTGLIMKV